ncbi:hypothetical protein FQN49_007044 [Arthroderma sp. PD_2]|nr:hypothetical protein FQN49_007044 [Arthroderma sp. PD_2]
MRTALEDNGLSRRTADSVAKSNDLKDGVSVSFFGKDLSSSSVPRFKFWMVMGFFALNMINICSIHFRAPYGASTSRISPWTGRLGGVVTAPSLEPFKVAGNALDELLFEARGGNQRTLVTVLAPIKYSLSTREEYHHVMTGHSQGSEYGVSGRMVGSLLTSLEDPVLSKWIILALALSVVLNGYLFKAARLGIKGSDAPSHPIDPKELADAERFSAAQTLTSHLGLSPRVPQTKHLDPGSNIEEVKDSSTSMKVQKQVTEGELLPKSAQELSSSPSRAELDNLLGKKPISEMNDEDVVALCLQGRIPGYALEKGLKDCNRAVKVRRSIISRTPATAELTGMLENSKLPYEHYNWERVLGACCENVIGYMPIPLGVAGPLVIDSKSYYIPMATTEGVLVASASRGCKAINLGGGAVTVLTGDGITRGPCISFPTLPRAGAAKLWLDSEAGQNLMKKAFNSTSRIKTTTGDAMGMNMISKGVEHALGVMASQGGFEDMSIITLSGNYCTDKKPAAINWIDGRGKGMVAEAIIPATVVKEILKSDVDSMIELNVSKNLVGSAMAGSIGGFNAQAANLAAAIFIATGQDPAQVVESANCITLMKNFQGSLQISVSMPSIEVGTLGGGTILEPQGEMLDMLGVRGSHPTTPGDNARQLARIIAGAVLAGELSLCAALAAGHLVRAHMAHNRSTPISTAAS